MKKMKLHINAETFNMSTISHSIDSILYIELGDVFFPNEQWWDISSSVIIMWLDEINRHILGTNKNASLHFMDGDYSINLRKIDQQTSLASFINPQGEEEICEKIDILHFGRQLLSAASKIVASYSANNDYRCIQDLIYLSNKLRTTLQNIV